MVVLMMRLSVCDLIVGIYLKCIVRQYGAMQVFLAFRFGL